MTFGSCQLNNEIITSMIQTRDVPINTVKNSRFSTALFMDCIAEIPCSGVSRYRAFITNAENAKNNPAINPEPSHALKLEWELVFRLYFILSLPVLFKTD